MNFQISRAGRPKLFHVKRDASGKSRGETTESIIATGLTHRLKQGIPYARAVVCDERTGEVVAANADTGHLLGQLKLLGHADGISEKQFFIGMGYAKLIFDYARIMGIPIGSPKSPGFELTAKGSTLTPEPEEDHILKVRGRYNDCVHLLAQADRNQFSSNRVQKIVRQVCQEQISLREFHFDASNLGNLRMGLNVLSPMFHNAI